MQRYNRENVFTAWARHGRNEDIPQNRLLSLYVPGKGDAKIQWRIGGFQCMG